MKAIPVIFKFFFAGFFAYLFLFILDLNITLFDSYDYMIMAKYNAGFQSWFPLPEFPRPPFLPVLFTPLALLHHFEVSYETIFTLMHLFSLTLSFGFIYASYRLFGKGLRQEFAALGALLMLVQPGFLVYSFETMADIPAGLLMIFSIFIYLSYRKTHDNRRLTALCLVIALSVLTKYPLAVAPIVFIGAELTLSLRAGMKIKQIARDRFYYMVGLLTPVLYIILSVISLSPKYGWTLANLSRAFEPYLLHIGSIQSSDESLITNASFFFAQMTAPLFLLMCAGLIVIWRRKNEFNIVMFIWLAVFLSITSAMGAHYEYRYLFPLVPACYFFCALGMQELFDYTQRKWSSEKYFPHLASMVFLLLMVLPALGFAREIKSLNSGFYENDFQQRVARASENGKDFYWFGALFAMYQKDAPFHPDDPYYKIYHFWLNGINYYTDQRPQLFLKNMTKKQADDLKEGDTLIYNPVFELLQTKYLPPPDTAAPLSIGKIYPTSFTLEGKSDNQKTFSRQGRKIILNFDREKTFTIGISEEIPLTRHYFILFKLGAPPRDFSPQTLFPFKKGFTWSVASDRQFFNSIEEIMLINFESEDFYYRRNKVRKSQLYKPRPLH